MRFVRETHSVEILESLAPTDQDSKIFNSEAVQENKYSFITCHVCKCRFCCCSSNMTKRLVKLVSKDLRNGNACCYHHLGIARQSKSKCSSCRSRDHKLEKFSDTHSMNSGSLKGSCGSSVVFYRSTDICQCTCCCCRNKTCCRKDG